MSKLNLPQTKEWINKYRRYSILYLSNEKTTDETIELDDLKLELAPYIITSDDYNAILNGIASQSDRIDDMDNKVFEDWRTAILLGSWQTTFDNPLQYRRNGYGDVEIRGSIEGGTEDICNLSVDYRPEADIQFLIYSNDTVGIMTLDDQGNLSTTTSGSELILIPHTKYSIV